MTAALAAYAVRDLAARAERMDALAASIRAELEESRRQAAAMETRR